MEKSCGIIPFKYVHGVQYFFVGHPGGFDDQKWAYLKGRIEDDENELDTAIREFHEESGVSLESVKDSMVYLGSVKQRYNKIVTAFSVDLTNKIDIDPCKCVSNLCDKGWPEIDKYAWMTWDELKPLTNVKHYPFYETIIRQ